MGGGGGGGGGGEKRKEQGIKLGTLNSSSEDLALLKPNKAKLSFSTSLFF